MTDQLEYKAQVFLALGVSLVWCLNPFLSIFLILFLIARYALGAGTMRYLLLLMAASFGLIAYTTKSIALIDTDVVRYGYIFDALTEVSTLQDWAISIYLEGDLNPGFQLINFALAKLFPSNSQVLFLFWVTVTYFFSLLMFHTIIDVNDKRERRKLALLLLLTLAGFVSFGRATDSIKQSAATAIFGYGIARELMKKGRVWLVMICAILVHMSALILLPIFLGMRSHWVRRYLVVIFLFCALLSFVNIVEVLGMVASVIPGIPEAISYKLTAYTDYESPASIRILMTFLVYVFMVLLVFLHYRKWRTYDEKTVLTMQVVALCVLLVNKGNPHNFMRYVYGYAPFIGLAFYSFISYKDWKKNEMIWVAVILAGYIVYANISYAMAFMDPATNYANSYVDNSLFNLLTYTASDYLNYRVIY